MLTGAQRKQVVQRCLNEMDVGTAHRFWAEIFAHLPQPKNYHETRITLHVARTQTPTCRLLDRLYSHDWLVERGIRSMLPDELRPKPQQVRPRIVEGVGLVVRSTPRNKDRGIAIRQAMERGIMEMYDAGITDPVKVAEHMWFRASQVREW